MIIYFDPTVVGIGLAGALGALTRYGVDTFTSRRATGEFPWGTFVVNISGSFVIGVLFTLLTERWTVDTWVRHSLVIGFLGAYTTFSTLSLDTYRLFARGEAGLALVNMFGSVVVGLAALYLGILAGRLA